MESERRVGARWCPHRAGGGAARGRRRSRVLVPIATLLIVAAPSARAQSIFPDELPEAATEPAAPPPSTSSSPPSSPSPSSRAPDEPTARFGEAREIVLSGSAIGSIANTRYVGSEARAFGLSLAPGVDVFVGRHVSLGLSLGVRYGDVRGYGADGSLVDTKTTSLSGGPRLGYVLALGERVSLWPRLTFGVSYAHHAESLVSGSSLSIAGSPVGSSATSNVGPWASVQVPLLVHVEPHFFLGLGPWITHDFSHTIASAAASSASAESTSVGLELLAGGFFGGAAPTPSSAPEGQPPPASVRRAFGDVGRTVLTNELDLGASYTSYAGTGSSTASYDVLFGLDHFASEHLSIGFAAGGGFGHTKGLQPDGSSVDAAVSSLLLSARVGVDVPLIGSLSLWPRLGLTLGATHYTETSGDKINESTRSTTTLSVTAPLLVHPAPHFFFGVGPSFTHDLSGKTDRGSELRATSFGLGGILGGWL